MFSGHRGTSEDHLLDILGPSDVWLCSSGVQRFYDARGQHLNFMPPTPPTPPPQKNENFCEISLSFKLHIN